MSDASSYFIICLESPAVSSTGCFQPRCGCLNSQLVSLRGDVERRSRKKELLHLHDLFCVKISVSFCIILVQHIVREGVYFPHIKKAHIEKPSSAPGRCKEPSETVGTGTAAGRA